MTKNNHGTRHKDRQQRLLLRPTAVAGVHVPNEH